MRLVWVAIFQGMIISAIMYADDIILLSPSVRLLQQLVALCEQEFNELI